MIDKYICRYCSCFKYSHFNKHSKLFHMCQEHHCAKYGPADNLVYLESLYEYNQKEQSLMNRRKYGTN